MKSKIVSFRISPQIYQSLSDEIGENQIGDKARALLIEFILGRKPSLENLLDDSSKEIVASNRLDAIENSLSEILARLDTLEQAEKTRVSSGINSNKTSGKTTGRNTKNSHRKALALLLGCDLKYGSSQLIRTFKNRTGIDLAIFGDSVTCEKIMEYLDNNPEIKETLKKPEKVGENI